MIQFLFDLPKKEIFGFFWFLLRAILNLYITALRKSNVGSARGTRLVVPGLEASLIILAIIHHVEPLTDISKEADGGTGRNPATELLMKCVGRILAAADICWPALGSLLPV